MHDGIPTGMPATISPLAVITEHLQWTRSESGLIVEVVEWGDTPQKARLGIWSDDIEFCDYTGSVEIDGRGFHATIEFGAEEDRADWSLSLETSLGSEHDPEDTQLHIDKRMFKESGIRMSGTTRTVESAKRAVAAAIFACAKVTARDEAFKRTAHVPGLFEIVMQDHCLTQ